MDSSKRHEFTYLLSLIVLENTAHGSRCGAKSRIETVYVFLFNIGLGLRSKPYLKRAGLVVGTIRAGDELFVFSLEGEPSFQIKLL